MISLKMSTSQWTPTPYKIKLTDLMMRIDL